MRSQRSLESGLFASFWDDGLLDLLFGCAVLTAGLGWIGLGAIAVLHVPIWITLWPPLRRAFVEPHGGYVRFSQARQKQTTHHLALTLALGLGSLALVGLVLFSTSLTSPPPANAGQSWIAGLPALLVAIGASLAGALTQARRFFAYALLLVLCGLAILLTHREPELALVAGGLGILVGGALQFRQFRRDSQAFADSFVS